MRHRYLKFLLVLLIVALPFIAHALYLWITAWPPKIVLAGGPVGGRHRMVMEALAEELRTQLKIEVELVKSNGSLQNLRMLESGKIDFGLYQSGARLMIDTDEQLSEPRQVRFVSNMYSEVAHWVVRQDAEITPGADSVKKRIAVGQTDSGDAAMSAVLLEHFGLEENDYTPEALNYNQIRQKFRDQTLDEALITVGVQAEIFRDLCEDDSIEFRSLEQIDALVQNHIPLTPYTIPKGLYRIRGQIRPATDIQTVAVKSQLLCRAEIDDSLVERVTAIALSEKFMKRLQLGELFSEGTSFALSKPEFTLHPGASHFFDPQLKPIVNSDFVEALEGLRSFIVSLLIAVYLGWRWWLRRNTRMVEHRLDRYVHRLLAIERKQVELGERAGTFIDQRNQLQVLLDEVTDLRQDCLKDFTAHELNEDRSIDCFLEMCHALSDKINARLTRVTLDSGFEELRELMETKKTGSEENPPAGD